MGQPERLHIYGDVGHYQFNGHLHRILYGLSLQLHIYMTNRRPRKEFSKAVKIQAWDRSRGFCEECGAKLFIGKFVYDHRIPWVLSEDSSLENCRVQCANCDKPKTAQDQGVIAKVRRIEEKRLGIDRPKGRPMPGTIRSGLKKKMDGTVEKRT